MGNNQFYNYDIDLQALEETQDPKDLVGIFSQLVDADNDYKIAPCRSWVEHFLYYSGNSDLFSRIGSGTVTGNSLTPNFTGLQFGNGSKRRIPKTFKACQIMAANLTKERPGMKVWPNDEDEQSVKDAKLSNILLDYLWDVDSEDDINYEMAIWALLSPAVARKDYLDFSFNKSRLWPVFEPQMDQFGNAMHDPMTGAPISNPKLGKNGTPVLEQLPWSKPEVVSAFRLIFNPTANWINSLDFVGDVSVKRMMWIEQNYSKNEPGYHPENIALIQKGLWKQTALMAIENALKQLTFGTYRTYRNFNYSQPVLKDGVTFLNFFIQPSPNYPNGREIAIANGQLLYDGNYRAFRDEPIRWHPYSFLCYERVPGRLWGTTYAEKIVDINRSYEQARSEFDQLRKTFSKPKLALPIGCQIETDTVTGNEQIWRYNPFGPDGGKPQYLNAPQPPTNIVDDTKLIDNDFTMASGISAIQMGMHEPGTTTFREVEILREESNNASNNFIRMYEKMIQISQGNKLENLRKALVYPSNNLTNALKVFRKMSQSITDLDIQEFTGQNLSGYVRIEPYSTINKSKLAMQEKYMAVAGMQVLGDIANDPDLNTEFKRKMDIQGFDRPQNKQVIFARYENQQIMTSQDRGQPIVPPVNPWDDGQIHIREVMSILLDPTNQNKPLIMQAAIAHFQAHEQQLAVQAMQAAQQQANLQVPVNKNTPNKPNANGAAPQGSAPQAAPPGAGPLQ